MDFRLIFFVTLGIHNLRKTCAADSIGCPHLEHTKGGFSIESIAHSMQIRSDLSPWTSLNFIGFISRLVSTTSTSSSNSRPQILQYSFIVSPPLLRGFLTTPCAEPPQGFNVSVFALKLYTPFSAYYPYYTESDYFEMSNPAQSFTTLSCVLPAGITRLAHRSREDRSRAEKQTIRINSAIFILMLVQKCFSHLNRNNIRRHFIKCVLDSFLASGFNFPMEIYVLKLYTVIDFN